MADFDWLFLIEVLVGGLLSGIMYSLVAIGFVLIYKTSGVLNFAQGSMLLFAALTFVSLVERGVPFVLALAITFAAMVLIGIAVERTVLRPLTNKPPITLFMATLGSPISSRAQPSSLGAHRSTLWSLGSKTFLSISAACSSANLISLRPRLPPSWSWPCRASFATPVSDWPSVLSRTISSPLLRSV